jgi:hypothetical protein
VIEDLVTVATGKKRRAAVQLDLEFSDWQETNLPGRIL